MTDNTMVYWGSNQHGLLSAGPQKSFNAPQTASFPHSILYLSASEKHISFITTEGIVYSYGVNLDGRLGVGGKPDLKHTLNNPARVKLPAPAIRIKCGFSHVCVQLANEDLYAWGLGDYGSLGTGQFRSRAVPTQVQIKRRISNFSCGAMHSAFVDQDGSLFTCGSNEYGELGVNKPQKIATPMLVNFGQKVKQVECGVFYTIVLTSRGQVFGMGNNKYGQLGIGHKVNECHPTHIRQLDDIVTIAAGYHSGALNSQGHLFIWGSGSFGQLLKPKKIILPVPVDQLFIRGFFGAVASTTHQQKVFTWGNNTYGQLGSGNYESSKEPIEVSEIADLRFSAFACGVNFFVGVAKGRVSLLQHGRQTRRNRFEYLSNDKRNRSPYNYGVRTPHRDTAGVPPIESSVSGYQHGAEAIRRSRERSRDRTERDLMAAEARLRSRSREREDKYRDVIDQEIRRSRNRNQGYEELFMTLSTDYDALLTRYKALEDHLQSKQRAMLIQKEEMQLFYRKQSDLLLQENELLKRELATAKEGLLFSQSNSSSEIVNQLTRQNTFLKEEVVQVNAQIGLLKEEQRRSGASNLKEQFKTTILQMQSMQEEMTKKDIIIKEQARQLLGKQELEEEIEQLRKETKVQKEELKILQRKHNETENDVAVKGIQLKEVKHRKSQIQNDLKQENQLLNEELNYVSKEARVAKDDLRITLKKLDGLEEQLALKSLEVSNLKQRRAVYDATEQLKAEVEVQQEELTIVSRENKVLKQELREGKKRYEDAEEEIAVKSLDLKATKQKLALREKELQQFKSENLQLSRESRQIRDELKKTVRQTQILEDEGDSLKEALKVKEESFKALQKRSKKVEEDYLAYQAEKQAASSAAKRQIQQLSHEVSHLENERTSLTEQVEHHKGKLVQYQQAADRFYEEREEKQIALEEKREMEQKLGLREELFKRELTEAKTHLITLKEVQELNEIRTNELKAVIEGDQRLKGELVAEMDVTRIQSENLLKEKQELFRMIEEIKKDHESNNLIYKDRIIELEEAASHQKDKQMQIQIQLDYERQLIAKCEQTIQDLNEGRDRLSRDMESIKKEFERAKDKIKDQGIELQKIRVLKKENETLTLQLEKTEATAREYKQEVDELLMEKEEIIKQMRADLERKQREVDRLEEKYETETASLQRESRDLQKKWQAKTREVNEAKKEIERRIAQIQTLRQSAEKMQRKLMFKQEEFEKEVKDHERTMEEFNNLRRDYSRLKSEKDDMENRVGEVENEKRILQGRVQERKREIEQQQGEINRLEAQSDNLRKETELARKQLQESNWALEQSSRTNEELSRANRGFAESEQQFTKRISELEGRIYEVEDENKSYHPRYESLLQRNKELDERNKELSEMINKAIQIQAEAYKTNILKEVEINSGEIIQRVKEEQEYKNRGKRHPIMDSGDPSEAQKMASDLLGAESATPGVVSNIKEEPYTRYMREKVTAHKKKVSESAQKLAGILDLNNEGGQSAMEGKSFARTGNNRRSEDYEQINSQMESLANQKQEFMQKISSFAEKLKIL